MSALNLKTTLKSKRRNAAPNTFFGLLHSASRLTFGQEGFRLVPVHLPEPCPHARAALAVPGSRSRKHLTPEDIKAIRGLLEQEAIVKPRERTSGEFYIGDASFPFCETLVRTLRRDR